MHRSSLPVIALWLMTLSPCAPGCGSNPGTLPEPDGDVLPDAAIADTGLADAGIEVDSGVSPDGAIQPPDCDYYSSPQGGGTGADGSQQHPWGPLEDLAAAGQLPSSGTLCLTDGLHGQPLLQNVTGTPSLTIRALNPHQAVVHSLRLVAATHLTLSGLQVDGASIIDPGVDERQDFLVTGDVDTTSVVLDNMLVQSADTCETWDQDGWKYLVRSGVDFRGSDITLFDSEIRNTYHALLLRGDGAWVEGTLIDNFGGDGIRGLGSDSTYQWNTVRDAYIDEYSVQHDDAFQAYKLDGDLRIANVTIRHNRFLLFADPLTTFVIDNDLVGTLMQGIIITDGYADGWVVENNLIVNGQSHGISLFGGRNCRVQNNTVVAHPDFVPTTGPWIRISDQTKSGHANFDNVIRNNLAQMLTPWDYDSSSLIEANIEISSAGDHFEDAAAGDFHLLSSSTAVDMGVSADLTAVDLDGLPRVAGAAVDVGAFERP